MSPRDADRPTEWALVALLIGSGVVASMQLGKVLVALPAIRAELLLGLVATGFVVSMFNAVTGVLGALSGIVGDRFGHRRVLIVSYALLIAGGALGVAAPDGAALLVSRFLEGFGFVGIIVGSPAMLGRVAAPRHQRLVYGLYGMNLPGGVAMMMIVAAFVIPAFGWRGLWLLNVALCAAMLVLLLTATGRLAAPAPEQGRRSLRDLMAVVAQPGPWLLALSFVVYGTLWSAVVFWMPAYMVEEQGRPILFASLVGAAIVGANAIGNAVGARLNHAGIPAWLLVALSGGAMGVLALFIFPAGVPELAKYALAFAFSLVGGLIPSSLLGSAPGHAPSPALVGSTLGLVFQGAHLGSFAGPPLLAAVVAASGGWADADGPLLACGLIVIVLALSLRLVERRLRRRSGAAA